MSNSFFQNINRLFNKQNVEDNQIFTEANMNQQNSIDELIALSNHWNGFEREKVVQRLGLLGNAKAIPCLIIRTNDWVYQVRDSAKKALLQLLILENIAAFIESLPDLYHLNHCSRDNHQELISTIIQFLIKPENNVYIIAAITDNNPYVARIAVRLCLDYSLITKQELVTKIIRYPDIVVRRTVIHLLHEFTNDVLESFLTIAIKDYFMPIRREAFQLYLKRYPVLGLNIACELLLDRHYAIREPTCYEC